MQKFKTTLTLLFFLASLSWATAQEKIERTFSGVQVVKLTTSSGNGFIKRSNTDEIKVTVEFTYDEDDYEPTFEKRGDVLEIEEEFRRSRWTKGYAEWTLEIPNGLELDFRTGSGNIEVRGVNLELNTNTGSGNIEIDELNGELKASTGSGNITLSDIQGDMKANTGSGSIRMENAEGAAKFNTGSGNIRVRQTHGELSFNTGSGNIDVEAASIMGSSSFNTGSGNAKLELDAALDHDLSISTGSGDAILDFNGQPISGEFVLKANDEDDIRAPFDFDRAYEEDRGSGWRGRNKAYVKEAKVGNKNIQIRISTGSGKAEVRK